MKNKTKRFILKDMSNLFIKTMISNLMFGYYFFTLPPSEIIKCTSNHFTTNDENNSFAKIISKSLDNFLAMLIYPSIISDSFASFSILNLTSEISQYTSSLSLNGNPSKLL